MKIKEKKGWKRLNTSFTEWYQEGRPEWKFQKKWLSRELVKGGFIKEKHLDEMWRIFNRLTENCSTWAVQGPILSFIVLCMDEDIAEDLDQRIQSSWARSR